MNHVHALKRIRERKTNYHRRSSLLLSKKKFITIKITNQNILSQVLEPSITGDKVITSAHSGDLAKLGWKGSLNALPACYLTGLLLGKKAIFSGIEDAILYTGKDAFTERISACLKGIIDSGVRVPSSNECFPSIDRISGKHIANYASDLKSDSEVYNKKFSSIIEKGLDPENYQSHFEEFKEKIMNLDIQTYGKDKILKSFNHTEHQEDSSEESA